MAFRKFALEEIGGFDPQYRIAGDDVDVCWRLEDHNWTLGFSPSSIVWHHPRTSVSAYLKQQINYGKAEALLESKWPEKYNALGHFNWGGQIYANQASSPLSRQNKIKYGVWGSNPFQSIYDTNRGDIFAFFQTPDWYLLVVFFLGGSMLGVLWPPLLVAIPIFAFSLILTLIQAIRGASGVDDFAKQLSILNRIKFRIIMIGLYFVQPMARLWGRLKYGLSIFRRQGKFRFMNPMPKMFNVWSENWKAQEKWLEDFERQLKKRGMAYKRGGEFDRWDMEIRGGLFGVVRTLMAIEEHGSSTQLIRFQSWPKIFPLILLTLVTFVLLTVWATLDQVWVVSAILGLISVIIAVRIYLDCTTALTAITDILD
jgi:hypothetical protein